MERALLDVSELPPIAAADRLGAAMSLLGRGLNLKTLAAGRRDEMRRAYETGLTVNAVARHFEVSKEVVRQAILDAGGSLRPRGHNGIPS